MVQIKTVYSQRDVYDQRKPRANMNTDLGTQMNIHQRLIWPLLDVDFYKPDVLHVTQLTVISQLKQVSKKTYHMPDVCKVHLCFLWPPCVADADIIFLPRGFYLSFSIFFSSPNLSRRRLDVYHTSTHGVALVRI